MNSMKMDIMPRSECLISESLDFRKEMEMIFLIFEDVSLTYCRTISMTSLVKWNLLIR